MKPLEIASTDMARIVILADCDIGDLNWHFRPIKHDLQMNQSHFRATSTGQCNSQIVYQGHDLEIDKSSYEISSANQWNPASISNVGQCHSHNKCDCIKDCDSYSQNDQSKIETIKAMLVKHNFSYTAILKDPELIEYLLENCDQPKSLQRLCRKALRPKLRHQSDIDRFKLPLKIRQFINYEDV